MLATPSSPILINNMLPVASSLSVMARMEMFLLAL
jgi:hypothetical protein